MEDIRIGLVQMNAVSGRSSANLDLIESYAAEGHRQGTRVLCFPELSISGYYREAAARGFAEPIPGPAADRLVQIAQATDVVLLAGLLERGADGFTYNTHLVASPDGILGRYRKTHIAPCETDAFSAGDDVAIFAANGLRFGIEICFDSHFPELSTRLSRLGADVLFLPHASTGAESYAQKRDRWMRFIPARAYDNTVFVAVCNQTGPDQYGDVAPGVSFVCDPHGNVIVEADGPDSQLIVADLKGAVVDAARADPNGYFLPLHRQELYA